MTQFFIFVILTALYVAFMFKLFIKWGVWERLQVNAPSELIHALLLCDYCRCFWMSVIIAVIIAFFEGFEFVFIPVFSTPLALKLL